MATVLSLAYTLPVAAGTQYSAYTNITAFAAACDGTSDTYSAQLGNLAESGLEFLGYSGSQYRGTDFDVARVKAGAKYGYDKAFYVHTHGDYYGASDTQGFRVDDGHCSGAPVVDANDIDAVRYNPPTSQASVGQVVIMSTCFLGENPPAGMDQFSMSEAWGIAQNQTMDTRSRWGFYMGYKKEPFTSDEREFEGKFWSRIKNGNTTFKPVYSLAQAFTYAKANSTFSTPPGMATPSPMWYGNKYYTGWWDTRLGCTNCQ